ncbi:hypothetical protein cyc_03906 [Cyclospora cayetanensis]|uniref:Uncharacterized protein n=1 Tax=Cyclospora cayetanensis TaxID=88456 RepID=A0A1D3CXC5_9EIME|nr:hypothetical protein cyc_03906 [Cyclospora cayetanensis]
MVAASSSRRLSQPKTSDAAATSSSGEEEKGAFERVRNKGRAERQQAQSYGLYRSMGVSLREITVYDLPDKICLIALNPQYHLQSQQAASASSGNGTDCGSLRGHCCSCTCFGRLLTLRKAVLSPAAVVDATSKSKSSNVDDTYKNDSITDKPHGNNRGNSSSLDSGFIRCEQHCLSTAGAFHSTRDMLRQQERITTAGALPDIAAAAAEEGLDPLPVFALEGTIIVQGGLKQQTIAIAPQQQLERQQEEQQGIQFFQISVLARRSQFAAGTRFYSRGLERPPICADAFSDCISTTSSSFCSKPLGVANEVEYLSAPEVHSYLKQHFHWLLQRYEQPLLLVDLVRQSHPVEGRLSTAFREALGLCVDEFAVHLHLSKESSNCNGNSSFAPEGSTPGCTSSGSSTIADEGVAADGGKAAHQEQQRPLPHVKYYNLDWHARSESVGFDAVFAELGLLSSRLLEQTGAHEDALKATADGLLVQQDQHARRVYAEKLLIDQSGLQPKEQRLQQQQQGGACLSVVEVAATSAYEELGRFGESTVAFPPFSRMAVDKTAGPCASSGPTTGQAAAAWRVPPDELLPSSGYYHLSGTTEADLSPPAALASQLGFRNESGLVAVLGDLWRGIGDHISIQVGKGDNRHAVSAVDCTLQGERFLCSAEDLPKVSSADGPIASCEGRVDPDT